MPIRITGMNSGLDTEAIITQLTAGLKKKKDSDTKAKTLLEWKQDSWKELNTKMKKLHSDIGKLRFSTAYAKKKTTVSDPSKATITASDNAINGTQTLKVTQMAKSAYLTGGKLADSTSGSTKLSDLGIEGDGTFKLTVGGEEKSISYSSSDTMDSLAKKFSDAGVKANFDKDSHRFFVAAQDSGAKFDFTLSGTSGSSNDALSKLGLQAGGAVNKADYTAMAAKTDTLDDLKSKALAAKSAAQTLTDAQLALKEEQDKYKDAKKNIDEYFAQSENGILTEEEKADFLSKYNDAKEIIARNENDDESQNEIARLQANVDSAQSAMESHAEFGNVKNLSSYSDEDIDKLAQRYYDDIQYAKDIVNAENPSVSGNAIKIDGQNGKIVLNGAEFESNTNSFSVNGLTIQATGLTAEGEELQINTDTDVNGIFDTVKNVLKQYNEIINEMAKLYNADAAKGFEPLTDEEKEEMSDKEVEKWESKVKDAMFRRDSNMGDLITTMSTAMMKTYQVNGKTMALSSLGIHTLGYLNADKNEQYAYHIDGDEDDATTGSNTDKLKSAIAKDPGMVTDLLSQVFKGLYTDLDNKMKSTELRSRFSIYNDKEMKTQVTKYESSLKKWDIRIADEEDKYYKQFGAMEKALAKLQSSTNALAGMGGGM